MDALCIGGYCSLVGIRIIITVYEVHKLNNLNALPNNRVPISILYFIMDSLPPGSSSKAKNDSSDEQRAVSCQGIAEPSPLLTGPVVTNPNDMSSIRSELDELWKIVKKLQERDTVDGVKPSIQDVDGSGKPRKVEESTPESEAAKIKRNILTLIEEHKSVLVRNNCQQ
jgi:hypothetical protein